MRERTNGSSTRAIHIPDKECVAGTQLHRGQKGEVWQVETGPSAQSEEGRRRAASSKGL
jgi:hypothetical protein